MEAKMTMTAADVKRRIAALVKEAQNYGRWDDEKAHGMEDDIYKDVLVAIAHGSKSPKELARLALTVSELNFSRWCA